MRLSDLLTRSEFRTDIYWHYFRPWGAEYEMCVGLDAPLTHTKVFLFNRAGRLDVTERDRAVLDFLRPHLANPLAGRSCASSGSRTAAIAALSEVR